MTERSSAAAARPYTESEIEAMTTEELLLTYKQTNQEELKWPLVLRYVGLVRSIALQVRGVYSSFAQVDDIINEGVLALVGAVDKFDLEKGVKFETYVSKRIRGAVIDLARRQDWVPRSVRRKAREIDQVSNELFAELGRYPSDEEMTARLGITVDQYQEDLANSSLCNILSLDSLFEDREKNSADVADSDGFSRPEESLMRQELLETLTQGVASLRENEQLVVSQSTYSVPVLPEKPEHEGDRPSAGGQRAADLPDPLPGHPEAENLYEAVHDRGTLSFP